MKLAQSLALIITGSASFVIPLALAQFHVVLVIPPLAYSRFVAACPSYSYNCACFYDGFNRSLGPTYPQGNQDGFPKNSFSVNSGLCGFLGVLNFYLNSDGTWSIYEDKGNATSLGTCYPTTVHKTCPIDRAYVIIDDSLVCYSNICN